MSTPCCCAPGGPTLLSSSLAWAVVVVGGTECFSLFLSLPVFCLRQPEERVDLHAGVTLEDKLPPPTSVRLVSWLGQYTTSGSLRRSLWGKWQASRRMPKQLASFKKNPRAMRQLRSPMVACATHLPLTQSSNWSSSCFCFKSPSISWLHVLCVLPLCFLFFILLVPSVPYPFVSVPFLVCILCHCLLLWCLVS